MSQSVQAVRDVQRLGGVLAHLVLRTLSARLATALNAAFLVLPLPAATVMVAPVAPRPHRDTAATTMVAPHVRRATAHPVDTTAMTPLTTAVVAPVLLLEALVEAVRLRVVQVQRVGKRRVALVVRQPVVATPTTRVPTAATLVT